MVRTEEIALLSPRNGDLSNGFCGFRITGLPFPRPFLRPERLRSGRGPLRLLLRRRCLLL